MNEPTRCRRCGMDMTLYVVGEEYCRLCKREVRELDEARLARRLRRFVAKDLTDWRPGA